MQRRKVFIHPFIWRFSLVFLIIGIFTTAFLFITTKAKANQDNLVTFYPVDMAVVNSLFPDIGSFLPETLDVSFSPNYTLSFLRFDFSKVGEAKILSASLSAYLLAGSGDEQGEIALYTPADSWCGQELSWNTKPPLYPTVSSLTVGNTPGWVSWDVTALATSWLNQKEANYSVVLAGDHGSFERQFAATGEKQPRLVIETDRQVSIAANIDRGRVDPCKILGKSASEDQLSLKFLSSQSQRLRQLMLGLVILVLVGWLAVYLKLKQA